MTQSYIIDHTPGICPNVLLHTCKYSIKPTDSIVFSSYNRLIRLDYLATIQSILSLSNNITHISILNYGKHFLVIQQGSKLCAMSIISSESFQVINYVMTPYKVVTSIAVDLESKFLLTIGHERGKEMIMLWSLIDIEKDIPIIIKQGSPSHTNQIKFCPFDSEKFLTYGKENIREWTMKKTHFISKFIGLGEQARDAEVLCCDFTKPGEIEGFAMTSWKMYFGLSNGNIAQICYSTKKIEALYKVSTAKVTCLCSTNTFMALGSSDGHISIWSSTFSNLIVEAQVKGEICSICLSKDNQRVAIGTLSGEIGLMTLDEDDKKYKSIMKNPRNVIEKAMITPNGKYLCTLEKESNCLVLWNIETKLEEYHFDSSDNNRLISLCFPVKNDDWFIGGFSSGFMKIFDIKQVKITKEIKVFDEGIGIYNLAYILDETRIIALGDNGMVNILDSDYICIKQIIIDNFSNNQLSVSVDSIKFALMNNESNCAYVFNSTDLLMKNRIPIDSFLIKHLCLFNSNLIAIILECFSLRFYSLYSGEGVLIKEINSIYHQSISSFYVMTNYKYFITLGDNGIVKVFDTKMAFDDCISSQSINTLGASLIAINEEKKVLVSIKENEGIVFWEFNGDTIFTDAYITQMLGRLGEKAYIEKIVKANKVRFVLETQGSTKAFERISKTHELFAKSNKERNDIRKKHTNASNISKIGIVNEDDMQLNPHKEIVDKQVNDLNKKNQEKHIGLLDLNPDNFSRRELVIIDHKANSSNYITKKIKASSPEDNISFQKKLYFSVGHLPEIIHSPTLTTTHNKTIKKNPSLILKSKIDICIGISTSSFHNIILSKDRKWYAYTLNNKIIIEFLQENRSQLIVQDTTDELNSLALTPNQHYLLAGVGWQNREAYASLLVYDISTWKLHKSLNFHYKGIQSILISPNNRFMVTIGTKDEKSLSIWSLNNLTVIDSKSVKNAIIAGVMDKDASKLVLTFITISFHIISLWTMNTKLQTEGFHINQTDLEKEPRIGESFICLDVTEYNKAIESTIVIIGTNYGSVYLMNREVKEIIGKYQIAPGPITHVLMINSNLVISDKDGLIYNYQDDTEGNDLSSCLEKEENRKVVALGNQINSISLMHELDGLVLCDNGVIYYVKLGKDDNNKTHKIISAHINCIIQGICINHSNKTLLSLGNDGIVNIFSKPGYDHLQSFKHRDSKVIVSHMFLEENSQMVYLLIDSSYIEVIDYKTMSLITEIRIPNESIVKYSIWKQKIMIVLTQSRRLFMIMIKEDSMNSKISFEYGEIESPKPIDRHVQNWDYNDDNKLVSFALDNGSLFTMKITIDEINIISSKEVDDFNMVQYQINQTNDKKLIVIMNNTIKTELSLHCDIKLSSLSKDVAFSVVECLPLIFIRNVSTKEILKIIPIGYHPLLISLSPKETTYVIGMKEGKIAFIYSKSTSLTSEVNNAHYDSVNSLIFIDDNTIGSTSHSEIILWNIK